MVLQKVVYVQLRNTGTDLVAGESGSPPQRAAVVLWSDTRPTCIAIERKPSAKDGRPRASGRRGSYCSYSRQQR